MAETAPSTLPLLKRLAITVGLVISLVVLMALAAVVRSEREAALDQATDRGELMARVLADHAGRGLDAGALLLTALGETVTRADKTTLSALSPVFASALLGVNHVRSVALLDSQGRVQAASDSAAEGLMLDRSRLRNSADRGGVQLVGVLPGRGLRDLTVAGAQAAPGVGMILMQRPLVAPDGRPMTLLAVLNPDVFANYQQRALEEISGVGVLASYTGQVYSATAPLDLVPGASITAHPVFKDWLPAREYGAYVGAGLQEERQIVAYRTLRGRPMTVVVEQSEDAVLAPWRELAAWRVLMAAFAVLVISVGTAIVYRSICARERARAALDEAHESVALRERELSVLMKSVQELIFRTDSQGMLTFVNARWAALSPEPAERALGRSLQDLVEPICRHRVAALFERDVDDGLRTVEVTLKAADGRRHRLQVCVVPLHARGRLVGYAGSAVDVTERYEAQRRLTQELAFTALLLDVSPYPISLFDAEGRYVTVNRAWEAFTGRARDTVIGTRMGSFMSSPEREEHDRQHERLLAGGASLRYEAIWRHRDGSQRDVVINKLMLRDELGQITGTLNTLIDVSEFREAERATREARDAAEDASRVKSEFIANISHELRTPLQSILGFSELGQARAQQAPRLAEMFGDIHVAGQRMLALVNDLLDVSKIESTVGTLDLERCDLRSLVRSVLRELQPLAARRQLQLQARMPAEPLHARVDPLRLQQVLRNVIANAIKFSAEGSVVEIAGDTTAQREVQLAVSDRGPGIPAAELESIFEAFVQSSKTKDGSGGTGLGLAICRKIVEIHGGRISASNRADGGARFDIVLPSCSFGETLSAEFAKTTIHSVEP
jgi:PAS domain S-box-containing protein